MVERGGTLRYPFTPRPTGTRWYHSHNMAGTDLTRSLYAGPYGFLIVVCCSMTSPDPREMVVGSDHFLQSVAQSSTLLLMLAGGSSSSRWQIRVTSSS